MRKLLLSLFSALIIYGSIQTVSAADFSWLGNHVYDYTVTSCSYNGYNFLKPVAYRSGNNVYIICSGS